MNQAVRIVKDYYNSGYQKMRLDTDTLIVCTDNLTEEELQYILANSHMSLHTADAQYKFFMQKMLARYHDIIARRTRVDADGSIELTIKSSVIELCEDAQSFEMCKQQHISRICDLDAERVMNLPIDVVSKLMAASMVFQVAN